MPSPTSPSTSSSRRSGPASRRSGRGARSHASRPSSTSGTTRPSWPRPARSSPTTPCARGSTPSASSPSTVLGGSRTRSPPTASCVRCSTRSWASNRARRCRSSTTRSSASGPGPRLATARSPSADRPSRGREHRQPMPAARRRTRRTPARRRLPTGCVVGAAVAALAGGAALPVAEAPTASAAVPRQRGQRARRVRERCVASVPVGTNPVALASGGGALWVVNAGDDTVSRINPSTHAVEQTIDVGHDPRALVVTGDDLWVTNFTDRTVSRINVAANRRGGHRSTSAAARMPSPRDPPGSGSPTATTTRSSASTSRPASPATRSTSATVRTAWRGRHLRVGANGRDGTVLRIDAPHRGADVAPIRWAVGRAGIVRASDDVWVADELSQSVMRITVATRHTQSFDVGDGPTALAVLGGSVWVARSTRDT